MTHSGPVIDETLLALVLEEFTDQLNRDERPSVEEYARRYPELAAALRQMLPAVALMGHIDNDSSASTVSLAELDGAPQRELGDYRILREIGRGGMGVVYEAEQLSLKRRVALKILPFAAVLDPRQLQRFKNESLAAAQLEHPHIVPVYGVGSDRGVHYYAMRYIEGHTLEAVIRQLQQGQKLADTLEKAISRSAIQSTANPDAAAGSPSPQTDAVAADTAPLAMLTTQAAGRSEFFRSVAQMGRDIAQALDYAHENGIIHRDVKPANILIDAAGKAWITDFGLARMESDHSLTLSGDLLGTLRYMSPEQVLGKRAVIDHRADVYSLGATLYELLALRPAVPGDDRQEVLSRIIDDDPRHPREHNADIPTDLSTIVLKTLAKSPEDRYDTAADLAADLQRFLNHEPIHAKPPTLAVRLQKWARRHHTFVATAASILFMVVVGLSVASLLIGRERTEAIRQRDIAREERRRADDALQKTRRSLYASDLSLAKQAWDDGNVARMIQLLERHRPATAEPDLRGFEWHYLWKKCHSHESLLDHGDPVWSMAVSPDERFLASGSLNGSIKLWDLNSQKLLRSWRPYSSHVRSLAFSPDGKLLVCGGGIARKPANVMLWDVDSGALLATMIGHTDAVGSVAFALDGRLVASSSSDRTVRVWEVPSGKPIHQFKGHRAEPRAVLFHPEGDRVLSGGSDGAIWSWSLNEPTPEPWVPTIATVDALICSPDKHVVAAPCRGLGVAFLDLNSGHWSDDHVVGRDTGASCGAFAPDGKLLATGGYDTTIRLWRMPGRLQKPIPELVLKGHTHYITGVAFLDDGRRIVSSSWDGTIRFWEMPAARPDILTHNNGRLSIHSTSSNSGLLATGGPHIIVWALESRNPVFEKHASSGSGVLLSPDGTTLALFDSTTFELSDTQTFQPKFTLPVHQGSRWSVRFSPDGRTFAFGDEDNTIRLWDLETRELRREMRSPHKGSSIDAVPLALDFSPEGEILASAHQDRVVRLWDLTTGSRIATLSGHTNGVLTVAFSPDGSILASGSRDRQIVLWDSETRREKTRLTGHSGEVLRVAFSPDGNTLVSGDGTGTINFWDPSTGWLRASFRAHSDGVTSAVFSSDGNLLATADRATIKLWEINPKDRPGD